MRVRTRALIVLLVLAWTVGLRVAVKWHEKRADRTRDDDDEEWKRKAAATIAMFPPLAAPAERIGPADAARLDARLVIAMLRAKRTDELREAFEAAEDEFERELPKERAAELAWQGFSLASDMPTLDAWVEVTPDSFVGYVARASARLSAARHARPASCDANGTWLPTAETRRTLSLARGDLEQAIRLRPSLLIAHGLVLHSFVIENAAVPRGLLDRALEVCPACLGPRLQYLSTLRPDRTAMYEFAKESQTFAGENPRLATLLGYEDLEDCRHLERNEDYSGALVACERAIAAYPAPGFLHQLARINYRLKNYTSSASTLTPLLAEDPFDVDMLVDRARSSGHSRDWEATSADLRLVLQLDPTNENAVDLFAWFLERLDRDARSSLRPDSLDYAAYEYERAAYLVPEYGEFERARRAIVARLGASASEKAK
jgi:hypothetical protein